MDRAFAVGSVAVAPQVVVAPSNFQAGLPPKASSTSCSFQIASGAAVSACALALATGGRASAGKRRAVRGQAVSRRAVGTITIGQRVQWNGYAGVVKFAGQVDFAPGEWLGLELDEPKGMHDGSVFKQSYYTCKPKHGVFCQPSDLGSASVAAAAPAAAAAPSMPATTGGATAGTAAVGQKVTWKGSPGTVRFVGKVSFAAEEMVGIELDEPKGMHDGSLFGTTYFSCVDKHGVFCQMSEIGGSSAPAPAAAAPSPVYASTPTSAPMAAASPATSYTVGQKVSWKGNPGTVQFVGKVAFAAEPMIGVQLDSAKGMHNGSLFGETYFSCPDKHGVFCQAADLQ